MLGEYVMDGLTAAQSVSVFFSVNHSVNYLHSGHVMTGLKSVRDSLDCSGWEGPRR